MDGVDIAMLGTDGEATAERGPFSNEPYPAALRARIAAGLAAARAITERSQRPASLAALETELTEFHGQAILGYLGRTGIEASSVDVIGYHGHTVLHRPEQQLTVQLGDGAMLARMTGRPEWSTSTRAADMLAGGEGVRKLVLLALCLPSSFPLGGGIGLNTRVSCALSSDARAL